MVLSAAMRFTHSYPLKPPGAFNVASVSVNNYNIPEDIETDNTTSGKKKGN